MFMDLTISQFFSALFSIVLIDLVLAGDNAIVIGLACRNLPKHLQLKAIILGTGGAVLIRILATIAIVWLLQLKGLMLGGGLLLIWIGYKLLAKPQDHDQIEAKDSLPAAVMTIVVADAAMGVDNVIAVAGASHGSVAMVILGLCISIPIMVFGSTLLIKLMDRFPVIIDIGAAVIAYVAAGMITEEQLIHAYFANPVIKYGFIALVVIGVLVVGRRTRSRHSAQQQQEPAHQAQQAEEASDSDHADPKK